MDDERKKYVLISWDGMAGYVLPVSELGTLSYELMEFDAGEKFQLEVREYTQAEADALPEFEGW